MSRKAGGILVRTHPSLPLITVHGSSVPGTPRVLAQLKPALAASWLQLRSLLSWSWPPHILLELGLGPEALS